MPEAIASRNLPSRRLVARHRQAEAEIIGNAAGLIAEKRWMLDRLDYVDMDVETETQVITGVEAEHGV